MKNLLNLVVVMTAVETWKARQTLLLEANSVERFPAMNCEDRGKRIGIQPVRSFSYKIRNKRKQKIRKFRKRSPQLTCRIYLECGDLVYPELRRAAAFEE